MVKLFAAATRASSHRETCGGKSERLFVGLRGTSTHRFCSRLACWSILIGLGLASGPAEVQSLTHGLTHRLADGFADGFAEPTQPAASVGQDESADDPEQVTKDARRVEALLRLSGFDLDSRPEIKASVQRYLKRVAGTERFIEVVEKLQVTEAADDLLQLAQAHTDDSLGVEAMKALMRLGQGPEIREFLRSPWRDNDPASPVADEELAAVHATMTVLGRVGNKSSVNWLQQIVEDERRPVGTRNHAVRALGKSRLGEQTLMQAVEGEQLDERLAQTAADILHASTDAALREKIATLMPLPDAAGSEPLPPIAELVRRSGNVASGQKVFVGVGTCQKCHQIGSEGKNVGPDLSEIGSKLSRAAMYESILNPSAGISHNYENYLVATIDGTIVNGVLVSRTDDEVVLKDAEAIEHRIVADDIEEMVKQPVSIMPSGLQKEMTVQQLVDLVEYLMTLKKPDGQTP